MPIKGLNSITLSHKEDECDIGGVLDSLALFSVESDDETLGRPRPRFRIPLDFDVAPAMFVAEFSFAAIGSRSNGTNQASLL